MRVKFVYQSARSRFLAKIDAARDENGAMSILTLFLFILMLMMGGIAVDMMRFEHTRVTLQQTLDRSVLAAASLEQTLSPAAVVADYFAKAGLSGQLNAAATTVTQTVNSRKVTAAGSATSHNYFMHMMGINDLTAPAAAGAEQRRQNIEIVLVLDVSGSMNTNNKIGNLREAAKSFVDTVLANDTQNRVSIAIVPYNAQVNLGSVLRNKYNAAYVHGTANVNCLEVPASTYTATGISTALSIPMMAYADTDSGTSASTTYSTTNSSNSFQFCNPTTANIIRLPSNNITQLKNNIDLLSAGGNTSIMLGMRWGVALLDPGARTMYSQLISAGEISSNFSGRPYDFADPDKMKVIVLMTDGEHVAHTIVNDAYKTGLSPIYKSTGDGYYSIRHTTGRPTAAGTKEYWVPHKCTSSACTGGSNTAEAWYATPWNSGVGVVQQNWQNVWTNFRVSWVAWQFYGRALGTDSTTRTNQYNTALNAMKATFAAAGTMDTMLQQSCTAAKTQNIAIYGIAFEAPVGGQTQISNCSSSPKSNYYFNATGLNISSVFQTIAANISQLKLTQ
jgi:Flp pilus assembly protein TadG